jgi:hypothetical protein
VRIRIHTNVKKSGPIPVRSKSSAEALADFCAELHRPLDEIFNLIYIVRHNKTDSALAKRYLAVVDERLGEVREAVLTHCKLRPDEIKKVS